MEIVIKLSDDVYTRLFDNGSETSQSDRMDIETAIRRGVPIVFNANTKTPILDVIHKTIYQFLDICGDDEEVPMSDKDKLLLEVNKTICNNLKELGQDCEDAISREDALMALTGEWTELTDELIHRFIRRIKNLPPVTPQPCEDAVSRQAVKEEMIKYGFHAPDMTVTEFVEDCLSPVNPQPKAERWIPVSERPPEEQDEYMITWTTSLALLNNQGFIGIAEYELTEEFDHENNRFKGEWLLDDNIKNYPDVKVTAWMPLPEPYKPQESEGVRNEMPVSDKSNS